MNDFSPDLLGPYTSNLNVLGSASESTTTASSTQELSEFRQLLTMMMLSSFSMPGQSEGSSSSMGMGMNEMMAPLMLTLLEKLLSQQVVQNEAESQPEPSPIPHGMPLEGPITQRPHAGHEAFDIGVKVGTPVHTTMDGKVVYAGWNNEGYGNLVIVENGGYRTYYAHLSKIPVSVGDTVQAGTVVGLSGNTGNSTGPHLHYEVRLNGQAVDPSSFTLT